MMSRFRRRLVLALLAVFSGVGAPRADEGMWTFDNLPLKRLKEKYGFEPTREWIEQLRSAAVRFPNGSGSFVSADGLIMTNHHIGADMLQKISSDKKDYYKDGFVARSREEEIKAPDMEINVLVDIKDVTDQVNAAIKPGMSDGEAETARRGAIAEIEKESTEKSGLRSDVVTLYRGGRFALYTFKKYTDVRLVFAPEFAIAFMGGDPDNFEFPRFCLDLCLFRAYENDKPLKPKHYLKWSADGAKEGELIFVAGNPGRTSRLNTYAHLEYLRDISFPLLLDMLHDREAFLIEYGKKGPEHERRAKEDLFSYQNSRKAREGGLKGLKDPGIMGRKAAAEKELRDRVSADPAKKAAYAGAWDKIAEAEKAAARMIKPFSFLERGYAFDSRLFDIARKLVRLAEEKTKPNSDRLREYVDSAKESLEQDLFSPAPIYPEFEKAKLAHSLAYWRKHMPDDPAVARVLNGRSEEKAAEDFVSGTRLLDVSERKKLAEADVATLEKSDDAMIRLALSVDKDARAVRKRREDLVDGVETSQYGLIAKALFAEKGDSIYPDATFSLRLAYGTVKRIEQGEKTVPSFTTVGGAFEHAKNHGDVYPFELPPSWLKARKEQKLRLDTPFNFISTADIIGGNSGSPVVNRNNEVVGLIFDGNIDSLVLDFVYDDRLARAVSVDSRGMLHILKQVHGAGHLVEELTGGR